MTYNIFVANAELTAMMAVAGLLFGLLYFASLKRSVTLFVGGKGCHGPIVLTLGRFGAAIGFLLIAAKLGAAPLLGGFTGFLMARALVLRAQTRAG
jgi:N-ATPase, AtpR subunit